MARLTKDEQIEEWKGRAFALWYMLDDIDTYDEMARGDSEFRDATRKKIEQRNQILEADFFDLFPPGVTGGHHRLEDAFRAKPELQGTPMDVAQADEALGKTHEPTLKKRLTGSAE